MVQASVFVFFWHGGLGDMMGVRVVIELKLVWWRWSLA